MYIGRRPDGSIYGAWTSKQPEDTNHPNMEVVPDDHPDLVAFRQRRVNKVRPNPLAELEARITALEIERAR